MNWLAEGNTRGHRAAVKNARPLVFAFALTVGLDSCSCFANPVSSYQLEEWLVYHQCTEAPPDRVLDRAMGLQAFVVPSGDGVIDSGTLVTPGGVSLTFTNNGSTFVLPQTAGLTTGLTAENGGVYRFSFATSDGTGMARISALKNFLPLAPLQLLDFAQLGSIDSSQPLTIRWRNSNPATPGDYLQVQVYDTNGGVAYNSGRVPQTSSSVVLPAQTLNPNQPYYCYLRYFHVVSLLRGETVWVSYQLISTEAHLQTLNQAGVFQFDPAFATVSTSATNAVVTVVRTEGTQGAATVDYFTSDATALSNVEYVAAGGTLEFADGVGTNSIAIPLLAGTNATARHFILTLTNATGGAGIIVRPHKDVELIPDQDPESNILSCIVAKVRFYFQTNSGAAIASNLCDAARFYATVTPEYTGGAVAGTLVYPNGGVVTFTNNGANLDYERDFPSPAAMNAAYPVGNYTFRFSTRTDGSFRMAQTLGVERAIPVPHVANWDATQAVDPSQPFTLSWDRFVGATSNDVVRVDIRDPNNEYIVDTAGPYSKNALNGFTTNYTLAANQLSYGARCLVDVIFERPAPADNPRRRGMYFAFNTVHTTTFYLYTIEPTAVGTNVARSLTPAPIDNCPCEFKGHAAEHDPDSL